MESAAQLFYKIFEGVQVTAETVGIKAESIACLGKIAQHVGKFNQEIIKKYVVQSIDYIYECMTKYEEHEMREAGLNFFYCLASATGKEFEPIFSKLIDITLKYAESEAGIKYEKPKKELSLDTDSEEEDEQEGEATALNVKHAFLYEKSAAIHAIGEFALACPSLFAPYFKRTYEILENCVNYFYENVRIQTINCLKDITEAMVKFTSGGEVISFC